MMDRFWMKTRGSIVGAPSIIAETPVEVSKDRRVNIRAVISIDPIATSKKREKTNV